MKCKYIESLTEKARTSIRMSWNVSITRKLSSLKRQSSFARSFSRTDRLYHAIFVTGCIRRLDDPSHYNKGSFLFDITHDPLSGRAHVRKGISKRNENSTRIHGKSYRRFER